MKLATYCGREDKRVGFIVDGYLYDIEECLQTIAPVSSTLAFDMIELLQAGSTALHNAQAAVKSFLESGRPEVSRYPLAEVKFCAPIPRPGKLICLAGNYAEHILEGGETFPGKEKMTPRFFIKPSTTVIGTRHPIRVPPTVAWADWEVELAVVIGKRASNVTINGAKEVIAGYTIVNDISGRELTIRKRLPMQEGDAFFDFLVGKWPDTFAPMGPWLTTADELAHANRLRMRLWVNDELHQDGSTAQMIFTPQEIIAYISQFVTLEPGDVLCTGTPAGVGYSKNMKFRADDVVRCEIEGLGVLENFVELI